VKRFRAVIGEAMADVYVPPRGSLVRAETALQLYGFPATIGANKLTEYLAGSGYTVVQPHYPGTYDSPSTFTPTSAFQMVAAVARAIESGPITDLKRMEPRTLPPITVVAAQSFGCLVAVQTARHVPQLHTLLLLAPAITYADDCESIGYREDGATHLAYVQRTRPFTYRLGNVEDWLNMYAGRYDWPIGSRASCETVAGVVGTEDDSFDFSRLRCNFASVVARFLDAHPLLVEVQGGGHGVDTLLNDASRRALDEKLRHGDQ
jgi:pimeloyl-ACP methyl ester carboxylesterase